MTFGTNVQQTVTTEHLQHYPRSEHGLFQVHNGKYPACKR